MFTLVFYSLLQLSILTTSTATDGKKDMPLVDTTGTMDGTKDVKS